MLGDNSDWHGAEAAGCIHRLDHYARDGGRCRSSDTASDFCQVQLALLTRPKSRLAPGVKMAGRMAAARTTRRFQVWIAAADCASLGKRVFHRPALPWIAALGAG